MSLAYTVRPISDRTWLRPDHQRRRSQFTASWSETLSLLEREINALRGKNVVIECDVEERHIRLDGGMRADARPTLPAVVVAFESKHGPLLYRSDSYNLVAWGAKNQAPWQANVRAVAMTLEALRSVDRYGATASGEQYTGWKALPPGTGLAPTGMTTEVAIQVLRDESQIPMPETIRLPDVLRTARRLTHPDLNGGERSRWNAVDEAEQVLRRAGKL